jgi:nicotinamidase/pyrazinamidase
VLASLESKNGDDALNVSSNSDDTLAVAAMRTFGLSISRNKPFLAIRFHPENELISLMRLEELNLVGSIRIEDTDALIIVDMQNDFMPSGALGVKGGDEIIVPINRLAEEFHRRGNVIVMTQDWHPVGHLSFASSHGMKPYDPYESEGIGPILWPEHCVQGSFGAEFQREVQAKFANAIIRKGYHPTVDSYSTFIENDKTTYTGLSGYLKTLGKQRILLCGLALDYCIYNSARDGSDLGFDVVVPIDLTRAIDSPAGHLSEALDVMVEKQVQFIKSASIIT